MFAFITTFFANNPRIATIGKVILEIEKFVLAGAIVTYSGKPVYDKNGQLQTGFKAALRRSGKISLAVVTLGGTLVYDLIMDPQITQQSVTSAVETGFVAQHEGLAIETKKALDTFNKLTAIAGEMQEVIASAKAVLEEKPVDQLHAPEKMPA